MPLQHAPTGNELDEAGVDPKTGINWSRYHVALRLAIRWTLIDPSCDWYFPIGTIRHLSELDPWTVDGWEDVWYSISKWRKRHPLQYMEVCVWLFGDFLDPLNMYPISPPPSVQRHRMDQLDYLIEVARVHALDL